VAAYVIAKLDVTDAEKFENYRKLSTVAVDAHDGLFLVRGGHFHSVEGFWEPARLTVIEFHSWDSAMAYATSVEYGRAREARRDAAFVDMIVVQGV
jgi:uncharacterized protein (DUF1330 family)